MKTTLLRQRRGFTLIELLVTIAIISILSIVVVLTLNPIGIFQEARDGQRINDISTLNKAISLYYSGAINNPSTLFMGTSSVIYVSIPDPSATSTAGDQCQGLSLPALPTGFTYQCASASNYLAVNGTGWVPINFASFAAGSPISKLPIDPKNTTSTNLYYTYQTDGVGGYKLSAFFESQKDAPLMANDGGIDAALYEKGTNLTLASARGLAGYWPLDEGSGSSAVDWSTSGDNGTWNGGMSGTSGYYSPGETGTWVGAFNGTSTYVNIANNNQLNPSSLTVAAWVDFTATSSGLVGIVSKDVGGSGLSNPPYLLGTLSNATTTMCAFMNDQTFSVHDKCFSGGVPLNAWEYYVFTYDSGSQTATLYMNGSSIGTFTSPNLATSTGNLRIGQQKTGFNRFFDGLIGDVRIYNRALSAAEIQEIYNADQ